VVHRGLVSWRPNWEAERRDWPRWVALRASRDLQEDASKDRGERELRHPMLGFREGESRVEERVLN
jgi:hypothetical protein